VSFIPLFEDPISETRAEQLNPLVLAFIGDSVQTLYVRTRLAGNSDMKTGELQRLTAKEINATRQSQAAMNVMDEFTEAELAVFKRARNSHAATAAKNATIVDYKKASGYEAVIGYLYLTGQSERLKYILMKGEEI
jgi:ribonuclease-3 family protein